MGSEELLKPQIQKRISPITEKRVVKEEVGLRDKDTYFEDTGYYIQNNIIAFRCGKCFEYMSLMDYEIVAGGVTELVICPNCKTEYEDLTLGKTVTKKKNKIYLEVK